MFVVDTSCKDSLSCLLWTLHVRTVCHVCWQCPAPNAYHVIPNLMSPQHWSIKQESRTSTTQVCLSSLGEVHIPGYNITYTWVQHLPIQHYFYSQDDFCTIKVLHTNLRKTEECKIGEKGKKDVLLHFLHDPSVSLNGSYYDTVSTLYTKVLNNRADCKEASWLWRDRGRIFLGIRKVLTRICQQNLDISDCDVELIVQTRFNLRHCCILTTNKRRHPIIFYCIVLWCIFVRLFCCHGHGNMKLSSFYFALLFCFFS